MTMLDVMNKTTKELGQLPDDKAKIEMCLDLIDKGIGKYSSEDERTNAAFSLGYLRSRLVIAGVLTNDKVTVK